MSTRRPPPTSDPSMSGARTPPDEVERGARPDGLRPPEARAGAVRSDPTTPSRPATLLIPRSRGAASGLVLFILGIWGGIVPFVGPYFHYAYINYHGFAWLTMGRLWLSIIPGVVALLAGFELMRSANRPTASFASICGVAAGAWFIVGPTVSTLWNHGVVQTGRPLGGTFMRMIEQLGYFYALGAAILFFSALALGRLSMVALRDVRARDLRYTDMRRRSEPASAPAADTSSHSTM